LPEKIERLEGRVHGLGRDMVTIAAHRDDRLIVGGRECSRDEEMKALGRKLDSLPLDVQQTRRFPLGIYKGLKLGLVLYPNGSAEVELEGEVARHGYLSRESQGPRAVLNAAERLVGSYGTSKGEAEKDLELARSQLRDYEARVGRPFEHS